MNNSLFPKEIMDEMQRDNPRLFFAVEILYKSGPIRCHTAVGDYVIDGQVYNGVGKLGKIDPIIQDTNTGPQTVNLTLSGLDPSLTSTVMNEKAQGSKVKILTCAFDDDFKVTAAAISYKGRVSVQKLSVSKDNLSIEVETSDRFQDWQRKGTRRFTNESHQIEQPGDEFFIYTPQMSERPIWWGSEKDAPGFEYPS